MLTMSSIDAWLIDRVYEPLAHQLEARTGFTRFAMARVALAPFAAASALPLLHTMSKDDVITVALCAMNVVFSLFNVRIAEQMAIREGTANWFRHHGFWQFGRAYWIGTVAFDVYLAWAKDLSYVPMLIGDMFYLSHMYLLACGAMPPSLPREIAERAAARSGNLATVEN